MIVVDTNVLGDLLLLGPRTETAVILAPHEERVSTEHVLQLVSMPLVAEGRALLVAFHDLAQSLDQPVITTPARRPARHDAHPCRL